MISAQPTRRYRRRWPVVAVLVVLALMAFSCGSSDSGEDATQPEETTGPAPTQAGATGDNGAENPEPGTSPSTTQSPTGTSEGSTDGATNGEANGANSGNEGSDPESQETAQPDPQPATPTPPPGPTEPLTGEPLDDPSILNRPALAIKVGTSSLGRPQTGINQADILLEFRVETITRLLAVFHSEGAEPVGPVRSARSSDPDILANFGQPVYGHSGGNPGVLREIAQGQSSGKLYELRWDHLPSDYWRVRDRVAPFNLYTSTSAIWEAAPSHLSAPQPLFEYRREGEPLPASAVPAPGAEIRYLGGTIAYFAWDEEVGGWARWQDGTPHVDMARHPDGSPNPSADPVQVAPANLVVLQTRYTSSTYCNYCPEAMTVDSEGGVALVFTDGHLIRGQWSRASASAPWKVTDGDGNPVRLTPGQTFIALPGGDVLMLVEDFAKDLLENR